MKATDIMVNDWVYLSGATKYPMQVDSIGRDYCYLDFEGNEGEPFDGIYGENGVAPIPLTEEILKLNGAKYDCKGNFFLATIVLKQIDNRFYYNLQLTRYVHELQHLLRLYGLHDMADNFKIKKEEQL